MMPRSKNIIGEHFRNRCSDKAHLNLGGDSRSIITNYAFKTMIKFPKRYFNYCHYLEASSPYIVLVKAPWYCDWDLSSNFGNYQDRYESSFRIRQTNVKLLVRFSTLDKNFLLQFIEIAYCIFHISFQVISNTIREFQSGPIFKPLKKKLYELFAKRWR